jgi:hypothetical protein
MVLNKNSKLPHSKDKKAYLKLGLYEISKLELKNERACIFMDSLDPNKTGFGCQKGKAWYIYRTGLQRPARMKNRKGLHMLRKGLTTIRQA